MVFLITNFSFVDCALPGAEAIVPGSGRGNKKTTLTKDDVARLAKILGSQTVAGFENGTTLSDDQKRDAELYKLDEDLFANVARRGSLTVPSTKQKKALAVPATPPVSPASMPSAQSTPTKK